MSEALAQARSITINALNETHEKHGMKKIMDCDFCVSLANEMTIARHFEFAFREIAEQQARIKEQQAEIEGLKKEGPETPPSVWFDKTGGCKICHGEIPDGHSLSCCYYKLETKSKDQKAEIYRLKKHRDVMARALSEIKATSDGDSKQPIKLILEWCIENIPKPPTGGQR
jgi:hypothetical protein